MTNTSGSVLCCSRDYLPSHYFIVALPFFEDFDRSDRWDSTAIFIVYFIKLDLVGFEAGRQAKLSFRPVVNITFYHIADHRHALL